MSDHWILDADGNPVQAELMEWARWFETNSRTVARDHVTDAVRVSTVFLGLDHRFGDKGDPVLWETMIFGFPGGHKLDGYQDRYSSKQAALDGHARALVLAREAAETK